MVLIITLSCNIKMIVPPSLTSILDTLVVESERLEEASDIASPNLWTLIARIKAVKIVLKKVEKELLNFMGDDDVDREEKEKVEDFVIDAMSKAETFLYPEDYKLDKLVFSLLEKEDYDVRKGVTSFKDAVESLTRVEFAIKNPDSTNKDSYDVTDSTDHENPLENRSLSEADVLMENLSNSTEPSREQGEKTVYKVTKSHENSTASNDKVSDVDKTSLKISKEDVESKEPEKDCIHNLAEDEYEDGEYANGTSSKPKECQHCDR